MKFENCINLKLLDEKSTFIGDEVIIGENVTIYEGNRITGKTVIGNNVTIYPNCFIKDCIISDNVTLNYSQVEGSIIGNNCNVGPFARLRPKSVLADNVKVGNFVEVKNSNIGNGTKINHLAYVGDVDVGKNCNIGCGAIFVNYNGKTKNRCVVGDECFIGSNCNIIAPVVIEKKSYVCAGTTVTENVKADDFVIGRVRQVVKENRAHKYLRRD